MAIVVPSEIQSERGLQVLPLLTESVGKASQSANLHSHGEVLSLDVRCTNPFGIRLAPHGFNRCVHHLGWRIPVFFIGGGGKRFDELAVVYLHSKTGMDCVEVRSEAIGSDLEVSRRGTLQLLREGHRVSRRASSEMPCQNQFCVALNCNKAIGVAAKRIAVQIPPFLTPDKTPYLVALNIRNGEIADSALQEPLALVAYEDNQRKYCGVVKASKTLDCANRASLYEKLNRLSSFFQRGIHAAKRCGVIFGEGFRALAAAVALKTVAVLSKFLAAGIAVVTGHFDLPFARSKPIIDLGRHCGLLRVLIWPRYQTTLTAGLLLWSPIFGIVEFPDFALSILELFTIRNLLRLRTFKRRTRPGNVGRGIGFL